jgi:lipopolysaccharide export system protein LptA
MMSFKKNVDVKNPDYTMQSDSLQYNSRTKIIYFRSSTTVINKDGDKFDYEGGEYNTTNKLSDLAIGTLETKSYTIEAGSYKLDDFTKFYKLRKNVVMVSKEEQLIIYGQAADYDRKNGITKVYHDAYFAKILSNNDTLFIGADTLVSIESDDASKKQILAYNHVKIFRKSMQGRADSLEYRALDSTVYFYTKPVLWSDGNQITADSMSLQIRNNKPYKMFMNVNAFVISQDTLRNFNQIKGRKMTASFANSSINRVVVEGNGESLYFALDEEDQSFMGMNKTICSNITIRFVNGQVNNLSFYTNPDAQFIPPHELKDDDKQLRGFYWLENLRPTRSDVVKVPQSLPEIESRDRER